MTRSHRMAWVLLAMVACKGSAEPEFVESYLAAYCQLAVDCTDPAVAAFDGAPTVDDCRAEHGPEVATLAGGCKLDRDAAEVCLADLEGADCPAEGEAIAPASCSADTVWIKCDDQVGAAGDDAADEDAIEG